MKLSAYKKGSPEEPTEVSEIRIETNIHEIDQLIAYLQNIRDRHSPLPAGRDHCMDWIHFDGGKTMDGCDLVFLTKTEVNPPASVSAETI